MTAADLLVEAAEFLVGRRAIDHVAQADSRHHAASRSADWWQSLTFVYQT